jgi:hypothetical protein
MLHTFSIEEKGIGKKRSSFGFLRNNIFFVSWKLDMKIKVTTWLLANLILNPHYDVNQQCMHIVHLFSSRGVGIEKFTSLLKCYLY